MGRGAPEGASIRALRSLAARARTRRRSNPRGEKLARGTALGDLVDLGAPLAVSVVLLEIRLPVGESLRDASTRCSFCVVRAPATKPHSGVMLGVSMRTAGTGACHVLCPPNEAPHDRRKCALSRPTRRTRRLAVLPPPTRCSAASVDPHHPHQVTAAPANYCLQRVYNPLDDAIVACTVRCTINS